MAIIQANKIINSLVGQALGKSELIGSDASIVSLGNEVLSSQQNTEAIYNVLCERIGRTVNSVRLMKSKRSNMRRESMEWGVILQKLAMPLSDAVENPSWLSASDTSDGNVLNPANTTKPSQKLFNKVSTWEHDATLWDKQLRFAFLGATQAMAFMEMIFTSAYNSQEVTFRALDRTCRNSLIAYTLGTSREIHLPTLYKNVTGKTVGGESALSDSDFLIFAMEMISTFSDYMEDTSRSFNDGTMDRHTPKDLQSLSVLNVFDKSCKYVAKSQTYHDELVSMPNYEVVNFWQGAGQAASQATPPITTSMTNYKFNDVSGIDVIIGESEDTEVKRNGIVAVLHDYEALGTTVESLNTSTMYNPRRRFTNYFYQADLGFFNDLSENCLVFTI